MEIAEQTETRLVLKDPQRRVFGRAILGVAGVFAFVVTPLAIQQNGLIAGLIALLGAGLIALWGGLILRRAEAAFDAHTQRLTVKRSQTAKPAYEIPFAEIRELYLTRSRDESGPDGFQLFLATTTGDVQLSFAVYPRAEADRALDAAIGFLTQQGLALPPPAKPRRWPGQTRPVG